MLNDSWIDWSDAYDTPNGLGTEISKDRTTLRESMATTINKALGLDSKNKIQADDLTKNLVRSYLYSYANRCFW